MTEIKPLENYWVVIRPDDLPRYTTIGATEAESMHRQTSEAGGHFTWLYYQRQGYTCKQVTITFKVEQ